jgi:metal-responsive CopG/Arc/MetJ family transcriptional regulator
MKPIQILMDEALIRALDREAKLRHSDRSKLVREAVTAHLAALRRRSQDEQYRRGYAKHPQRAKESQLWEGIQEWPED